MIGKVILWILLALLALLVIALLIPVKARFRYEDGEPFLAVCYGPVKLQLFPQKEKPETAKKKKKKKSSSKKEEKKKPKKKFRVNMDQVLYTLEKLPPILGRALRRIGRSIRITPLKLYILAAGNDPASTAQLYGQMEAALAAGYPVLEKALRLKDADVRLYVDFQEEQMDFIVDAGVSLRPWSLVWIAIRAGGSLIKWFLGFRKLASPRPESKEDKLKQSETEHKAA